MLAIGIYYEQGFTASVGVLAHDAVVVAGLLSLHNNNGLPDEILLVHNDEVVEHWNKGKEY